MAWTVTALKLIAGSGNKRSTRSPRTHLRCIPLECHGSDSKRSGTVSWHTSDPFFFMEVQWGDHRKMGASSRPDFSHLCASSWATSRPVTEDHCRAPGTNRQVQRTVPLVIQAPKNGSKISPRTHESTVPKFGVLMRSQKLEFSLNTLGDACSPSLKTKSIPNRSEQQFPLHFFYQHPIL